MSNEVQVFENDLKEYKLQVRHSLIDNATQYHLSNNFLQLETVQSGLQADPDNSELQNLQTELEEVISLTEKAIAELKPASAPANARSYAAAPASPPKEKWSKENHPAYQAGYRKPAETPKSPVEEASSASTVFTVNESVLAKWKSGDKAFYPARITSITGSSTNPVYIVTFKSYATTETLSASDIKPLSNDKKRKADGTPGGAASSGFPTSASAVNTSNSGVISAAASINPTLASQVKREPSKVSDGPIRPAKVPRKVKANKELEAGKNKWQDFTTKGKTSKVAKKDSMFRTPDGVNARGRSPSTPSFFPSLTSILLQWDSRALGRLCARILQGVDTFTNKTAKTRYDVMSLELSPSSFMCPLNGC